MFFSLKNSNKSEEDEIRIMDASAQIRITDLGYEVLVTTLRLCRVSGTLLLRYVFFFLHIYDEIRL